MLIKLSITKPGSTCLRFTLKHKKGATAVAPKHENILLKKLKKLTTINKVASLAAG